MSDGFIIKRGGGSGGGVDPSIIERTVTNITADMLKGITKIGAYAFGNYSSLTSIEIPNGVTSILDSAFKSCNSLASVTIPSSVTSIGEYTFYNCGSLTSITIPSSVTSIGNGAFQYCSSLASIEIPNSVASIGNSAFKSCSSLASVTIKATTPPTLGTSVFDNNSNLVIYVPAESVDAYKAATNWSTYASKIQAIPSD